MGMNLGRDKTKMTGFRARKERRFVGARLNPGADKKQIVLEPGSADKLEKAQVFYRHT
jgi:hypothetical protein